MSSPMNVTSNQVMFASLRFARERPPGRLT
jgi:hypothetical protein